MSTIAERDELVRRCWIDARFRLPDTLPEGPHYGVTVLAVIQDAAVRVSDVEQYIDWATWWPATRKWTVTHCGIAADPEHTVDYPVNVTFWQPRLALPWL